MVDFKRIDTTTLVSSSSKTNNKWTIEDANKIKVVITDNLSNPYIAVDRLYLTVLK